MHEWMGEGPRSEELTDPAFCDVALQEEMLRCKSVFDGLDYRTFTAARLRSNPFELIQKEMFQNRAALKMAEMDAMFHRLFTMPPAIRGKRSLLYFADIAAGPGGFSEFMLSVLKWRAKGFGFTIRGDLDFKLNKFNTNAPTHSFKAYYGVDDTGDLTQTRNIRDFAATVWEETGGKGLHVVLADGGFSVRNGNENKQELLSRQLILCQFAAALATLGEGGVFMCKVFDTFLPFTVHMLYILRLSFRKFCMCKPNQSRPANSERYVVCEGLKAGVTHVVEYLYRVNDRMTALAGEGTDVLSVVPPHTIREDFTAYMRAFNEDTVKKQIAHLRRIKDYIEDKSLPTDDQELVRHQSLAFWDISEAQRKPLSKCPESVRNPKLGKPQDQRKVFYDGGWGNALFGWQGPTELMQALCRVVSAEQRLQQSLSSVEDTREIKAWWDWFAIPVPAQATRLCVVQQPRKGMSFIDQYGDIQELPDTHPSLSLPPDVVLDVMEAEGALVVLDAWTLPSNNPADIDFYKTRPRFVDRCQMVGMFVESIRCPALRHVTPLSITDFLKHTAGDDSGKQDWLFIRGNGPKPTESLHWRRTDGPSFSEIRDQLDDIVASYAPPQRPQKRPHA